MLGNLFNRVKDMFIDRESGSLKLGTLLTVGAGVAAGAMLLGPAIGVSGLVGGLIGGAGALLVKEVALPMITGGGNSQAPEQPTQGFAPVQQQAPAQGHHMEEPHHGGVPHNRPNQVQR